MRGDQEIKSGRTLIYGLMSLVCLLTFLLIGWYAYATIQSNAHEFEHEAQVASRIIRQHADTAIVRVKDLSAFVAAGREDAIAADLRTAKRRSKYIKEYGYFYPDRPGSRHIYFSDRSLINLEGNDLANTLSRLKLTPGVVVALIRKPADGIFGGLQETDIVFAQELNRPRIKAESGQDLHAISYAILDFRGVLEDVSASLTASKLIEARYVGGGTQHILKFRELEKNYFADLWTPNVSRMEVLLTRNLTPILEFQEIFSQGLAFALFVTCLLLLLLSAVLLFVIFERRSRSIQKVLTEAAERERKANSAKSEFLANMSHEIRTPLNGVLGMAELLMRSKLNQTQLRYADQIKTSGSTLLMILNDILDMSKLESGELAIDPVSVNLSAQLREMVDFYSANARNKNLCLLLDVDSSMPPAIEIDAMRLRQVVGNLVSNAIKFTASGEIVISAEYKPCFQDDSSKTGNLTISVKDTGIGMSAAETERLFERFIQANSKTSKTYGGTGLGLAICKQITEAMNGVISVSSVEGKGSVFSIVLPVSATDVGNASVWEHGPVALICDSDGVSSIVEKALAPFGITPHRFAYEEELTAKVASADAAEDPFSIIIFDEGGDIHRAKSEWHGLKKMGSPTVRSIVLGDMPANRNYDAFDFALIKPFLGASLLSAVQDLVTGTSEADVGAEMQTPKIARTTKTFNQCKMLLIDDNQVNLLIAEEMFADYGFDVDTATGGKKAISMAQGEAYDIIFMDCQMPEMDGYEATGILRNKMAGGEIKRVPIVALTANALKGDREKCLNAGMDEFVSKPILTDSLNGVFERLLKRPEFKGLKGRPAAPQPADQIRSQALPDYTNEPAAPEDANRNDSMKPELSPSDTQPTSAGPVAPPVELRSLPPVVPAVAPSVVSTGATPSTPPIAPTPPVTPQVTPTPAVAPAPAVAQSVAAAVAPLQAVEAPAVAPQKVAEVRSAPGTAARKVPLMDPAGFQQTRNAMKKFDVLLSFYRTDTADYLDQIRQALAAGEIDDAILPAHTIKSSSQMLGAVGLSALAELMETRLRSGKGNSVEELSALLSKMEAAYAATMKQVDLWLKETPEQKQRA